MTGRALAGARVIAAGRVALGAALLLAPSRTARGWVGALADRPGVHALVRSLGARDMVIGLIALHTSAHPEIGPRWQRTCAAVDLVDAGATLAAARDLPARGVSGTVALAGASAVAELLLARA
ncbi:MAG: hypothetical protein NVSMB51_11000 [Solirubrobacteraceae bacterium]